MRVFKISTYNLRYRQNEWEYDYQTHHRALIHREIIPGQKVCMNSKLETMGVITHCGPTRPYDFGDDHSTQIDEVTVLWLTGKKKGKSEVKEVSDLADFEAYEQAVLNHLAEIDGIKSEAARTGM